jgi:hypothetical protein
MRRRVRQLLLLAIALLYGVSVPWYRRAGAASEVWLGLPDWVAVAVLCYAGVAVLNAVAWMLTDVPEVPEAARGPGGDDAGPAPGAAGAERAP